MIEQQIIRLANDFKLKYIEYLKNPTLCNMINYIEIGSRFQKTPYTYEYEGTQIFLINRKNMSLEYTIDVSNEI